MLNRTEFMTSLSSISENMADSLLLLDGTEKTISAELSEQMGRNLLADEYLNHDNSQYYLGCYEEAIQAYTIAISLNPDNAIAYYNRGNSKHELGLYAETIDDLNRVISSDPSDATLYFNRGHNHYFLGEFEFALEDFVTAILINKYYISPYVLGGQLLELQGKIHDAKNAFKKAIACVADSDYRYAYRGYAKMKVENDDGEKDYEGAIQDFNAALDMHPSFLFALVNRAQTKIFLNDIQGAKKDFQTAIDLPATSVEDYFWRGEANLAVGAFNKAIEDYTKALKVRPVYPEALAQRGLAYYKCNQLERAKKDLNRVLKHVPQFSLAQDYLDVVTLQEETLKQIYSQPFSTLPISPEIPTFGYSPTSTPNSPIQQFGKKQGFSIQTNKYHPGFFTPFSTTPSSPLSHGTSPYPTSPHATSPHATSPYPTSPHATQCSS